ncbi:MAG: potassium channel family protein [Actinomycetaceae bacterium]|nr:potassium channel family protein [Actinomycetaceae bacterium]
MNTPSALSSFADRAYGVLRPPRYDEPQLNAWAQKVDIPLALVAIVFLGAYAAPIIDPALPRAIIRVCVWTTNIVWLIFAADYLIRLLLVKHRWSFIRYHLFDLAIVGLPFFQPLRLLRLVFLLRVLNRHAGHSLRGQISSYVMGAAAIITLVGALAALDVERYAADSQITTFPEALWWAFVTITTVGYGDFAPVTHQGRLVATGMMIFGVALLGTVTATLASWLVESVKTDEEEVDCSPELQAIYSLTNQVEQLEKEIVSLKAQLNQLPSD